MTARVIAILSSLVHLRGLEGEVVLALGLEYGLVSSMEGLVSLSEAAVSESDWDGLALGVLGIFD
jgi:hypothetical protein